MTYFDYLYQNPKFTTLVSIGSGLTGKILFTVQTFMTNESVLSVVSALGVWACTLTAVITACVLVFKHLKKLYRYIVR